MKGMQMEPKMEIQIKQGDDDRPGWATDLRGPDQIYFPTI